MEDTLDDFIRKYKNTFVFLRIKDSELLVEFTGVNGDEGFCVFTSPDTGSIQVNFNKVLESVRTDFPESGLYNIGNFGFVEFTRVPERQWKRAPCPGNSMCMSILQHNAPERYQINYSTIEKLFFPKYPSTKEEAIKLCNERGGVALTKQFGITLSDNADYDLFFGLNYIGCIKDSKIKVEYPPLRQEVVDTFGSQLVWTN